MSRSPGWLLGFALGGAVLAVVKLITGFPLATGISDAADAEGDANVDCTVFSCPTVQKSEPAIIQVYAHRTEDARFAAARAEEADPGNEPPRVSWLELLGANRGEDLV